MPLNRAPRNSLNSRRRRELRRDQPTSVDRVAACMPPAMLVAPMCIFLMPQHFYLVALLLCAFMVILIRSFPREPQALGSERYG